EPVVLGTAANRFPTSTTPLEATTRPGSLIIGAITLSRAPGSRIESASTTQTYAWDARSKPQFSAPALLPPAHLSITRRRLSERLRQRLLTGWQETVRWGRRAPGARANSLLRTSRVPSEATAFVPMVYNGGCDT